MNNVVEISSLLKIKEQKLDEPFLYPKLKFENLGILNDFSKKLSANVEYDQATAVITFITVFSALINQNIYACLGSLKIKPNLFSVISSYSQRTRKSSAFNDVINIVDNIQNNLDNDTLKIIDYENLTDEAILWPIIDEALVHNNDGPLWPEISDKRLLILDPFSTNFQKFISSKNKDLGNYMIKAWNGEKINKYSKVCNLIVTNPHISLLTHINEADLLNKEVNSRFINKCLFACVLRKTPCAIPEEKNIKDFQDIIQYFSNAIKQSDKVTKYRLTKKAEKLWLEIYNKLSIDIEQISGSLTSRAETIIIKLATLFAILDLKKEIEEKHLEAALDIWTYSKDSALYLFAYKSNSDQADSNKLLEALKDSSLTQSEIYNVFSKNKKKDEILRLCTQLEASKKIKRETTTSSRSNRTTIMWSLA